MQKIKDNAVKILMYSSLLTTILILLIIIFYVFSNGASKINIDFLTQNHDNISYYVTFKKDQQYSFEYKIINDNDQNNILITNVDNNISVNSLQNQSITLKKGMYIDKINDNNFYKQTQVQITNEVNQLLKPTQNYQVKITIIQNGIRQLILTTLLAVFVSLIIAIPIGLFAAIYLQEYKIAPRVDKIIHFAIDSLAAIPSIVYGLFGFIFFCITLHLGISVLSGVLTISIMLLPTIIKTIEEALINVPMQLREASYALGATKAQTIFKIVIPASIPGILLAIILSIGRIVGESAIFIFTAGSNVNNPTLFGQGATLSVNAYEAIREYSDVKEACGIGIIILLIIFGLNLLAKFISKNK